MTQPVIRGTSHADLIGIPAVLLGFHPRDSCVVLAVHEKAVQFCVRFDVDIVDHFDQVVHQLESAASQVGPCDFVLIGFGEPGATSLALGELIDLLGPERVLDAIVTHEDRYWCLGGDEPPREYRFESSAIAAQAVYEGVRIVAGRDEAVAPVTQHRAPEVDEEEAAWAWADGLTEAQAAAQLKRLAESPIPLASPAALRLAVLLADDDRMTSVLASMTRSTVEALWRNLVAARQVCPSACEANVVALVGAVAWRSGRGAALTACLEQLAVMAPQHVVGGLLSRLLRDGVPPRWWDD